MMTANSHCGILRYSIYYTHIVLFTYIAHYLIINKTCLKCLSRSFLLFSLSLNLEFSMYDHFEISIKHYHIFTRWIAKHVYDASSFLITVVFQDSNKTFDKL